MPTVQEITEYYKENNIDLQYVPKAEQNTRMLICKGCDKFRKLTAQCKECGCFMRFKTKLMFDPIESHRAAEKTQTKCPIGLW